MELFYLILVSVLVVVALDMLLIRWLRKRNPHARHERIPDTSTLPMDKPKESSDVVFGLNLSSGWFTALEVGLVVFGVAIYCSGILDLGSGRELPGNEAPLFQAVDFIFIDTLAQYRQFPLWNSYIHTGLPYIADPMLHIYNPFISIPTLLMGVKDGFKFALFLSFLMAAIGMLLLGKILGISRGARLWSALMFTFAGQPVARFFQGEYLFIFGFAWIPWVLYALFSYRKTQRRLYLALTALFLAVLYFSGNAYYPFLMFFIIVIFALLTLFSISIKRPYIRINLSLMPAYLLIAGLTVGLIAVHLLPLTEFRSRMGKGIDVQGSHTLSQIFLDFTSKDTFRKDAYEQLPAREEFYAYIGFTPFIALALLPLAFSRRERLPVILMLLILLFSIMWINVDRMPWRDFYYQTRFFSQFRHVLRPLIFGSFALILLAGMSLDSVWKAIDGPGKNHDTVQKSYRYYLRWIGFIITGLFMIYGVWDVFSTNKQYIHTENPHPSADRVMQWLRDYDPGEFYVRHNPNNAWLYHVLAARLRYIDAWYHWDDIRRFDGQVNTRPVNARPNYVVQSVQDLPSGYPDETVIQEIDGYHILLAPHSLPMVFSVPLSNLQKIDELDDRELQRGEVTALTGYFPGPNAIEVIADGKLDERLVLLVTHYPGWQAKVDGQPTSIENIGGYLSTKLLPGVHKYTFTFVPTSFYLGLLISLLSLGIALTLIWRDSLPEKLAMIKKWDLIKGVLTNFRKLSADRISKQTNVVDAIHLDGYLRPLQTLELEEEAKVRIFIETHFEKDQPLKSVFRRWLWVTGGLVATLLRLLTLESVLFLAGLGIYLLIRIIGLTDFPIYFFTDEAIQTVSAAELLRDQLYGPDKIFLPTYFKNGTFYNLSLSVYAQIIPYILWGKSIFITRFTSVAITFIAAISVGLVLKHIYQIRYWWVGVLLLSMTPAWFLHSRTAFETAIFVSCYAGFLYGYLLYRYRSPRYLFFAILMGALSFYAYSPGQVVIGLSALLLFISDVAYHWRQRRMLVPGLVLMLLLAAPYLRFVSLQSSAPLDHLRSLNSYWMQPIPVYEKITYYLKEFALGLSPSYWFVPHSLDLPRHTMKGYGHLSWMMFPFMLLGLVKGLRSLRHSKYRALGIAFIAAPAGSALVSIGITRVLVFVIPAVIFTAIGLSQVVEWLENDTNIQRVRQWLMIPEKWIAPAWKPGWTAIIFFILLVYGNLSMLNNSLTKGPVWYRDFGLYGMQFGTRQIFAQLVPDLLDKYPDNPLFISSVWSNGTDIFPRFFLTPEQQRRIRMGSVDTFLSDKRDFELNTIFILTNEEYEEALASQKLVIDKIERIVPYPDGEPGFYAVRMSYIPNAEQLFRQEAEARRQPVEETIWLDGQMVKIRYSKIDSGQLADIFDGDIHSLARGLEANPFIIEMDFSNPRQVSGILADFGSMNFKLTIIFVSTDDQDGVVLEHVYTDQPNDPHVDWVFDQVFPAVQKIRIEILSINEDEQAKIHIREIKLIP